MVAGGEAFGSPFGPCADSDQSQLRRCLDGAFAMEGNTLGSGDGIVSLDGGIVDGESEDESEHF